MITKQCNPKAIRREALVPPHRRARVAFALIFFSLSLSFLNYVSTL